ncbi:unnamed protein product [Adineta steineri]|uniref:B box-type domain-containing protein n=1 Tax=Adineta steineri TaxID=433720 RepID=A0A814J3M6_9BILA|nr:unnamed protein product [Adineta steineri]CAF3900040.1 unnamed protein product [Adineta steineri]
MPPKSAALHQCDDCQSTEANYWCIECEISYCTTCSIAIHARARAHHRRVPIYEKPIESKRCEQHRNEKLKYWCDCEKLICMDCHLSEQHKNHRTVPMSKGIFDITEKLKTEFKEAQTSLSQAITKDMLLTDMNDNKNIQSITKTFGALRKMIDNYEKTLKNQICAVEEKNKTISESYLKQLNIKQKTLSDHNGQFENILSTNDHTQLLENKKSLTNYLEQLMKELKELKSPIKTEYRIEGIDQLQTNIDNILKQARIVELIPFQQVAITVVGGNGQGDKLNQLYNSQGIFIDNDKSVYIADSLNHRIVKWTMNSKTGQIVGGGNGKGNKNNQLYNPTNIVFDKKNNSFIISDGGNNRVVQYSDKNQTNQQILISTFFCLGLTIDKNGYIYASDYENHEVRRYKQGDKKGELVAGENGKGKNLNQLNCPYYIFIDEDFSLYISDHGNNRVMKWKKDAKEGIIVAGGNGEGNSLKQLSYPYGVIVDHLGQIYVADAGNHRVIRWREGEKEGEIVVGGNGLGNKSNQLNFPTGLSFDNEENLYVVDNQNHRIQKYEKILS